MKRLKIKEEDKLRCHYGYDKESNTFDFIVNWPLMRMGSADAGYLCGHIFTEEFKEELIRRGYDITTLKFSIAPKLVDPTRPEKFQKLIEKYKTEIDKINS